MSLKTHSLIENKVFYSFVDKNFKNSSHIYNISLKDEETQNNIRNIKKSLSLDELIFVKQVHGNFVYIAGNIKDTDSNFLVEADGIITTRKNVGIVIQTADCVPVLLSDEIGEVICVLHCGWKSALSDIISNGIDEMQKISKSREYSCVIGPCISQQKYEVQNDFMEKFSLESPNNLDFFDCKTKINRGKSLFDLARYVRSKLKNKGVVNITMRNECTYSNEDSYFSYRRSFLKNEECKKRILSIMWIR